jgi:RHS repeat-associated protein
MVWWILLVALLLVGGSPGRVPVPVVLDASFERGVRGQYRGTVEASGNVLTIRSSNPGGTDLTYDWTALNQLKSVTDARVSATPTTYEYDAEGNLDKVSYANGVLNDYGADARGRIKTLASTWNGSARGQFTYTFNAAGLRASVQELGGRTAAYGYDGLNRLTRETVSGDASGSNGVLDYGLDETGNRLARAGALGNLGPQSFTYNGNDQISGSAFDPNGNVTAAGGNSYHYTFENRLSGLNSGQVQYVHDGDGHRVRKIKGGVTTYYLVDEVNPTGYAQVLEELAAPNTTPAKLYGYGSDLISLKQGSSVFFYGYDAQGTVRYLTGGTAGSSYGQVTDTYTYDAFGNLIHRQARRTSDGALISFAAPALEIPPAGTQPADNWHRQYGEHWDPDLGMVYLRARYDHPGTARFWTMDTHEGSPSDPLSLHKYLYAHADAVNRIDPSGRMTVADLGSVMSKVSGFAANFAIRTIPVANKATILLYEGITGATVVGGAGLLVGTKVAVTVVGGATRFVDPIAKAQSEKIALIGFEHAGKYGVWPARVLDKILPKFSGLEKHHLIGRRFAETLEVVDGDIPSIVLTKQEHEAFTAKWLEQIARRNMLAHPLRTNTAEPDDIWKAAQVVYENHPELLEFVKVFLNK